MRQVAEDQLCQWCYGRVWQWFHGDLSVCTPCFFDLEEFEDEFRQFDDEAE